MIESYIERLLNWRRVYGDRQGQAVSITYLFCKYLEETTERLKETEEQRISRERRELCYRDEDLPPLDYKDARLLEEVWASMPDIIENKPVKRFIKVMTFGTKDEFSKMRKRAHINPYMEAEWRDKHIKLFFDRVETESRIREQLGYK